MPHPIQQSQIRVTHTPTVDNISGSPLNVPSQVSKRRKATGSTVYMRDDEYEEYYQLGKIIPRLVHPFLPAHHLLYYGSLLYTLQTSEDEELELGSVLEALDASDKETILHSFTILINYAPWLKEKIPVAIEDNDFMNRIARHVSKGSSQAHSDDSWGLKQACIEWIKEDLRAPLEPPLQVCSKAGRGFSHPVLAKMLCPGSKQDKFVEDPAYIDELKLGNVSDEDFPTFCYKYEICDPENLEQGLFQGTFLLRTFRRIFTGPSSVLSQKPGPSSKRKCNADIIGMTQVTPRAIAYAAVQARLVLSDKDSWDELDGTFSYRHFFESIVTVFEQDPELPWVKRTLKWWNKEVFLSASRAQAIRAIRRTGSPSMVQRLNEQRERANSNLQPEEE